MAHPPRLAPQTRYALELQLDGDTACTCTGTAWSSVMRFTTGDAVDDEPPAYPGLTALRYRASIDVQTDCGLMRGVYFIPDSPDPGESGSAVRYNVYGDATRWGAYEQLSDALFFVGCSADGSGPEQLTYDIRAVDLAGNESAAGHVVTLVRPCGYFGQAGEMTPGADLNPPIGEADAGVGFSPDAGKDEPAPAVAGSVPAMTARAPANMLGNASGCSLGSAYSPSAPLAIAWLSLAMWRRRRRHLAG